MADLYAMLVGIDRYAGEKVPNLSGSVNDVDAALDLLTARRSAGTELRPLVLRNEEATVAAVVDGLRNHLTQAGRGDTALLWFSGHGSEAPLPSWGTWFEEPTGMLQTLVCADSRSGDVRDLLDKELSVLLDQVAAGGAHVVAVLDSCHSEGVTRELGTSKRSVRPADGVLSRESLLPELAARIAGTERSRSPEHIALAACRRNEEAEERNLYGQDRGLFSWALMDAMRRLGPGASYRDLLVAAQTEMAQRRAYRQVPQLYPAASDLIHQPFLGGTAARPDAPVVMSYGTDGWEINAGSAHGLPVGTPGMRVGRPGDSPVREAGITQVQTVRSLVCPADGWYPERNRQYRVVLTEVPLPATTVSVTGDDPAAIESLDRAIRTAGPAGGPSAHVRRSGSDEVAGIKAELTSGRIWITEGENPRLAGNAATAGEAVRTMEHLARWRLIRELRNPLTRLGRPVRIEIVPAPPGVVIPETTGALHPEDDDAYRLSYEHRESGWAAPEIFVRLHNTSDRELYCVLLDLTGRWGAHAALFPGSPIGPGRRTAALEGRRIRVSLPDGDPVVPGSQVTDWLVLVVAEKQFSEEPFRLPPLGEPIPRGSRGLGSRGLLERLGERTVHREMGAATPADAAYDWTTEKVRVITQVP